MEWTRKCFPNGENSVLVNEAILPTFLLTLFPLFFTFSNLPRHSSFMDSFLGTCYVPAPWNTQKCFLPINPLRAAGGANWACLHSCPWVSLLHTRLLQSGWLCPAPPSNRLFSVTTSVFCPAQPVTDNRDDRPNCLPQTFSAFPSVKLLVSSRRFLCCCFPWYQAHLFFLSPCFELSLTLLVVIFPPTS